ncbi:MAG: NADH-quinone oxidoreductase subunit H [Methanomassiliicoccales archaeon]|jgi:formate hydrogenlyase subunit 4|nr:NADH-quinone oxidoreductase subunit H [Methanomassiliicoccales archaeon]HRU11768.1 NADH-quinone oxidoreductase subunit H [Methanomassiliicoccales archaeon]
MQLTDVLIVIAEVSFVLMVSPLLTGIIGKAKAWMQCRQGPSVLQPYRDLWKLMRKATVASREASWLFFVIPYVCLGAMVCLAVMVPVFNAGPSGGVGDMVATIYVLGLFRFMMVLGGLEGGSPFGGMGSSREMMISAIVEPTLLLSIFSVAAISGTTDLSSISRFFAALGPKGLSPTLFLASAAIFISLLAENSRVPFDNPATHLELTMVHEGMLLEYSGRELAMMEMASYVRLTMFMVILSNVFFPWGIALGTGAGELLVGVASISLKLLLLSVSVAVVESVMAKMRLFRLPNLLTVSFTLSLLAVMSYYIL